jgi:serine/tyrosine/threonine adenylyltransferase
LAQEELGAVVCRVAPTFLRFGSLELAVANQDDDLLQRITEFTIKHWYPQFASVRNRSERYLRFLQDVSYRTASLIAKWQAVGFTHGTVAIVTE